MPSEMEKIVLNAVGLKITKGGVLEKTEGYASFSEISEALTRLLQVNIRYL
jgi:hypothetical protein